jgi:ribosome-associated protein
MLRINDRLSIPDEEIVLSAIRAGGPGGQHVNKVSSAVHLRFDIPASSLPESVKRRLLEHRDQRISSEGVVVIKSGSRRSREMNRQDALERLRQLVVEATRVQKPRKPTRPSRAAKERRLTAKKRRAELKRGRSGNFE